VKKPTPPPAPKQPEPNPDWRYSPPRVSKDGRTVEIDAMQLTTLHEHYRLMGVPLVEGGRR
jgi:hypothetical protein